MAKTQQTMIGLTCSVCKRQNYLTSKNKTNVPDKLVLKKYCRFCRRHTEHKESSKFK